MRLLLVGYGRMGKLVEKHAPEYGFEVVGRLRAAAGGERCADSNSAEHDGAKRLQPPPWPAHERRP